MLQQCSQFRRLYVLRRDVSSASHLQGGRQVGQHHAQRFLMLTDVVGQGAGHGVLQEPFVGDQGLTVDGLNSFRIEIHRHYAD